MILFKIKLLITELFKIFKVNDTCSMIASCIPHCSNLTPAVTVPVLEDVIIQPVISILSPCNTGQCEGGEVIISLLVTHQTG